MKRSIALLAGVVVVLVLVARPLAAAPGAPTTASPTSTPISTPAVTPTGASAGAVPSDAVALSLSQVSGSGLAVTLDAGASEEHDLVVSNHTANLRLIIKLTATDATGNLGSAAASWLAFGDDAIQLDPHAATTVPMTIAVPHDTQPASALAHVTATVQSAVSAADGSPVAGTASQTFPVSITVRGTPTAQIAIADVHRVDQGSRHELAVVLRNFGAQGARVNGNVRVAGDHPQTLPFSAELPASRDTTVPLAWNAPPQGTASDIAVDLEYGSGNVASWSSRLGGAPTDLSTQSGASATTVTTIPTTSVTTPSPSTALSATATKPWWKRLLVPGAVILALFGAGIWFVFEVRGSRRRREVFAAGPAYYGMPPGWGPAPSDASAELAKQLVRLTEVIVELTTIRREDSGRRDERELSDDRPRARSPDPAPADAPAPPMPFRPFEGDELRFARAGPAPPEPGVVDEAPPSHTEPQLEVVRSASPAPGADARPAPDRGAARAALEAHSLMMQRLLELDRQRQQLRSWMDTDKEGEPIDMHLLHPLAPADERDTETGS
jgi:hypothetical protein